MKIFIVLSLLCVLATGSYNLYFIFMQKNVFEWIPEGLEEIGTDSQPLHAASLTVTRGGGRPLVDPHRIFPWSFPSRDKPFVYSLAIHV